jgi:FAD/FMN-containing dehydrogenase
MITVSNVFSSVPPLFTSLSKVITGDLDCSYLGLKSHSVDGSPYAITPQAILYPKTSSDIKHAIAFAREYHMPITVCGGRTAASGGALGEGIIIDMTRYFSHIRNVHMMEHTVTVDAGVRIDDLREKLAAWNMEIPVLQEEHSQATIGGLVATKSATSGTFYAGTIREWVEGLTVIVDSGEEHHIKDATTPSGRLLGIYQAVFPLMTEHGPTLRAARRECSDDATGYSLWNTSIGPRQLIDQLVGSEGTLAIITSITLRVTPKRTHALSLLVPVPSTSLLQTFADIAKHHRAEKLFMFDETYRKLVETFHSGLLPTTLPLSPFTLCVTMCGDDAHELAQQMETFKQALPTIDIPPQVIEERHVSKLTRYVLLHSLFKEYSKGTYMVATAGEGMIVPLHEYGTYVESLDELMATTGHLYTLTGYIGSGHVAVTTAFDSRSLSYEYDLQDYREGLFSLTRKWKGGISAVSGDGLERTAALATVYNEATQEVFRHLKYAWDPLAIFNPSKKLSITKEYLIKHATRTLE